MRWLRVVLPGVAILIATLWLYAPALRFELAGDDYQWVQHAHLAMHRPALLLADLDTFYRPASTWTLVLDRLLWGYRPLGYHLTNLLLHSLAGVGLALVGRRLGLSWAVGWVLGLLWATSPFSEEPAASVAIRFEDLLLLAWLGLILAWPRPGSAGAPGACGGGRVHDAGHALQGDLGGHARAGLRPRARRPQDRSQARAAYRSTGPGPRPGLRRGLLPRVPGRQELLRGFRAPALEGATPACRVSRHGGARSGGVLALRGRGRGVGGRGSSWSSFTLRRHNTAAIVGTALLLLPMLPTLLVPYLPTRYTAIPYAGFLLLLAGAAQELAREARLGWRAVEAAVAGVVLALVLVAGVLAVRADLNDLRRVPRRTARCLERRALASTSFPSSNRSSSCARRATTRSATSPRARSACPSSSSCGTRTPMGWLMPLRSSSGCSGARTCRSAGSTTARSASVRAPAPYSRTARGVSRGSRSRRPGLGFGPYDA